MQERELGRGPVGRRGRLEYDGMVRIRMKRMGRTHRPFYRINAVEKREKRDGKVLENLGWYDPVATEDGKKVHLKEERIKHWLGAGAQRLPF